MPKFRRGLAFILAAVMLLSLFSTALAAELELPNLDSSLTEETSINRREEEPVENIEISSDETEDVPIAEMTADTGEEAPIQDTNAFPSKEQEPGNVPETLIDGGTENTEVPPSKEAAEGTDNPESVKIGVTIGGQYVEAVPVDELPTPEDETENEADSEYTDEENAELQSLYPLEEHFYTLDLSSFWPEQLKDVTLQMFNENLDKSSGHWNDDLIPIMPDADTKIMWARRRNYASGHDYMAIDDFTIMAPDDKMDMSPIDENSFSRAFSNSRSYYEYLHLIVGKADQFETANVRYLVEITFPQLDKLVGYELDFRSVWPEQLKDVTLEMLNENLKRKNAPEDDNLIPIAPDEDTKIMWAKSDNSDYIAIEEFTALNPDSKLDMSPIDEDSFSRAFSNSYSYNEYLHLIVGNVEQFETNNVRYLVKIIFPQANKLLDYNYTLNFSKYWPGQMKNVTIQMINENLKKGYGYEDNDLVVPTPDKDTRIMWAKSNNSYYIAIDDFTVL